MRMPEEHRKRLTEEMSKIDTTKNFSGFQSWTSPSYRDVRFDNSGIFLRNIKLYKFIDMTPRIILMINDEGIYTIPNEVSNTIKEFLENSQELKTTSPKKYMEEKKRMERSCAKALEDKHSPLSELRSIYSKMIFDELIYENMENMVVVDYPRLVSKTIISKINCPIPIEVVDVPVFYLGGFRKWIWYDGDKIDHYGGFGQDNFQRISSEIKSIIRKDKIEKIGI